jgi:hypothetical protein
VKNIPSFVGPPFIIFDQNVTDHAGGAGDPAIIQDVAAASRASDG